MSSRNKPYTLSTDYIEYKVIAGKLSRTGHPPCHSGWLVLVLLCLLSAFSRHAAYADETMMFTRLPDPSGDPRVRSIISLPDGRLAFATGRGVDIFNGHTFSNLAKATGQSIPLPAYNGHHHLYLSDGAHFLWIKNAHSLQCIDLDTEIYSTDIPSILKESGIHKSPDDFFADKEGRIWILSENTVFQPDLGIGIAADTKAGPLLDLAADKGCVYLFYGNGKMACHAISSGKLLYSALAFPLDEVWKFSDTSLVLENGNAFYQIRNGVLGGFFRFDKGTGKCDKLLETDIRLNTFAISDTVALISTNNGLLSVNLENAAVSHLPYLKTQSGNMLASEISTLLRADDGSIWLGLLNRGILRHHPSEFSHFSIAKKIPDYNSTTPPSSVFSENYDGTVAIRDNGTSYIVSRYSGGGIDISEGFPDSDRASGEYGNASSFVSSRGSLFFNEPESYEIFIRNDSIPLGKPVIPFIAALLVNGERISPLGTYDGNVILNRIPSRQGQIELNHDQNFLTFEISAPRHIGKISFYYMLEGIDRDWNSFDTSGSEPPLLKATYTAVPPGDYKFRVKTSPDVSPETTLEIKVKSPWWATGAAFASYGAIIVALAIIGLRVYTRHTEKRIAAEQRERNLLERIRHLIEEVDRYKTESPATSETTASFPPSENNTDDDSQAPAELSDADRRFIAKAVELVEKNLDTPGYSVEQLSKDLCMERTGLYRKLTAMLDQSPSLFIRDIRLRNAARLLKEGRLSITEIAEATGFSSTSYMSKCFQERYGCRPSDYVRKHSDPDLQENT